MGLAFITLLRAYANGGSSLTGLEAISNGVARFREPESPNARKTLVTMSMHPGLPAARHHAAGGAGPTRCPTPSGYADRRRPGGPRRSSARTASATRIFFVVLLATVLILYTGGNTSFNGFPFLANYVAGDRYLPRQLTKRGHRLAFSNGIIVLGRRVADADPGLQRQRERPHRALRDRRLHGVHPGRRRGWWRATCASAPASGASAWWSTRPSASVTSIVVLVFVHRQVHRGRLDHRGRRARSCTGGSCGSTSSTSARSGPSRRPTGRDDQHPHEPGRHLRRHLRPGDRARPALLPDAQRLLHPRRPLRHRPDGHQAPRGSAVGRAQHRVLRDQPRDRRVRGPPRRPRRAGARGRRRARPGRVLHGDPAAPGLRVAPPAAAARPHAPTPSRRRSCTCRAPRRRSSRTEWGACAWSAERGPRRAPRSDEVVRGGVRDGRAPRRRRRSSPQRSGGAEPIGALLERQVAEIAGRVRSMTINHEGGGHELRCVLADNSGSVTLVFQGRIERARHRARDAPARARHGDLAAPRGRHPQPAVRDRRRAPRATSRVLARASSPSR